MVRPLVMALLLVQGVSLAVAPDPPDPDVSRARQIVQRAIAAHGGAEAWQGKKDVSFVTTWTHYKDDRPRFSSRYHVKFLTAPGAPRVVVETEENGKRVVMGVSGSRSWFVVGEERRDDVETLKANRAFLKKAYAILSLPFRLDDPTYRLAYDGHEVRGGIEVDRVRVEHGLEPSSLLLFERGTGRLAGLGSTVSEPPTMTLGEAHDFQEVDGILIARSQSFDRVDPVTGERSRALSVSVQDVRFHNGFPPETFEPPAIP